MRNEEKGLWDPTAVSKKDGRALGILSLVLVLALASTIGSFLLWRENTQQSDIARAASHLEDFLSENDAVAVFFGWESKEEADGD